MLEIRQLSKEFDAGSFAVRPVDLSIAPGEFFALLGPSGCGKTTLLRLIAGLETPTSGQILLDGKRIDALPPNQRSFNMVFQRYALFPHLSVRRNIEFGLRMKKIKAAEIRSRTEEALALVRLEGFDHREIRTLSGGQQQRVALARALVNRPRILLLDEPLSALDLKLRKEMQVELRAIQRKVGQTFIFVTHDQEEAFSLADRVAVMNEGVVEQVGLSSEIYEHPRSRFVARFIGSANLLSGQVRTEAGQALFRLECGVDVRVAQADAGPADLMIRPERIRLRSLEVTGTDGDGGSAMRFEGVIRDVIYRGSTTDCWVELTLAGASSLSSPQSLWVSEPNLTSHSMDARLGSRVWVEWSEEDALVIKHGKN
jgi:spermidine/putrescine ABC transporter ATP-binding subunit